MGLFGGKKVTGLSINGDHLSQTEMDELVSSARKNGYQARQTYSGVEISGIAAQDIPGIAGYVQSKFGKRLRVQQPTAMLPGGEDRTVSSASDGQVYCFSCGFSHVAPSCD
ncbi:MAG TPA: hypothetical protein VEL31_05730 [Ktedonobacteraceae bacterium]|nr:hypothetical protein [Ktedonobacteraceae bacterium]